MSGHSSGPWVTAGISGTVFDASGQVVATVGMGRLPDEYADDAALIAAAPDLLAACIDALAQMGGGHKSCGHEFDCVCVGDRLMAAIAKARGDR